MKILIDIVHPADVLFFKRPIDAWLERGDEIMVLSREKDVAQDLLNEFGFPHRSISVAGRGIMGLARELLARDTAVFGAARRFRPDVMIGFGGVVISHVGKLLGVPTIAFYDSENASLQNRLTWPFISQLYVPDSYTGPTPKGRTQRVPGTKELSYLYPTAFQPDQNTAIQAGLDPETDNFLIRIVDWRANHDLTKNGWDETTLRSVISHLSAKGKVHISSEAELPSDFTELIYKGKVTMLHHLAANCRLLVGQSATMASESAVLGVPSIYCGHDFPGYVKALEKAGLIHNLTCSRHAPRKLFNAIDDMLKLPSTEYAERRARFIEQCPDWACVVVAAADAALD